MLAELLTNHPVWKLDAACRDKNPDLFFTDDNLIAAAPALAVCGHCPVKDDCLQDALDQDRNPEGVWGGTTKRQRKRIREGKSPRPTRSGKAEINASKTKCKWGHEFTPENTRWYAGKRSCLTCYLDRLRERRKATAARRVAA
jgi:WhiB family redox-sensing transcriptional regulator